MYFKQGLSEIVSMRFFGAVGLSTYYVTNIKLCFSNSLDVRAENLNVKLKELGELYVHGRDKDGKVLMVFAVQKHVKGAESMDDLKRFFIYSMERVDRYGVFFKI